MAGVHKIIFGLTLRTYAKEVFDMSARMGPIKKLIRDLWRPKTELGRRIKHFLLTGEVQVPRRQYRRRTW